MQQRKKRKSRAKAGNGLPKLPKNGYKNVRKCGNSYQGYTPNKTHFTRVKPTAAAAAAALANKEYTSNSPKDVASVKLAKKHKPATTGAHTPIFFFASPQACDRPYATDSRHAVPCVAQSPCSLSGPTSSRPSTRA